jgi:hypothetical protein
MREMIKISLVCFSAVWPRSGGVPCRDEHVRSAITSPIGSLSQARKTESPD